MSAVTRRVRALPIRARLSLLVAAAVAFAVAAVGDVLVHRAGQAAAAARRRAERPRAWARAAIESALRRARLRGPELTITADVEPWYVRAEPAALERAVVNILDNAVKFSPEGGVIDVRLTEGTLTVRDHGPGISPAELPHVFDRFWRSESARSLPGSGLGLSIVARTVQQSGGEVTLAPAEGGGTVATIRLPGAPVPPPETPAPEDPPQP
ncbi:histidine kinase OS=Streptomyces fumanus OX=67302 GN=GCM10018772_29290 PE=4 SV=1 [Streptomyces fumanus]